MKGKKITKSERFVASKTPHQGLHVANSRHIPDWSFGAMLQLTPRILSAFCRSLSVLQRRRLRMFCNLLELQFSDLQTVSEMVAVSLNGSRPKLELWRHASHLITHASPHCARCGSHCAQHSCNPHRTLPDPPGPSGPSRPSKKCLACVLVVGD